MRQGRINRWLSLLLIAAVMFCAVLFERWYATDPPSLVTQGERIEIGEAKPRAKDGDSLIFGKEELRLIGIDAPELRQLCTADDGGQWPCGRDALRAFSGLLSKDGLECFSEARDRFGRHLARCRTSQTADIGAAMVAQGWAITTGLGDSLTYPDEEQSARAARRGIWRGPFELPRDYRDAHPRAPEPKGWLESMSDWLTG